MESRSPLTQTLLTSVTCIVMPKNVHGRCAMKNRREIAPACLRVSCVVMRVFVPGRKSDTVSCLMLHALVGKNSESVRIHKLWNEIPNCTTSEKTTSCEWIPFVFSCNQTIAIHMEDNMVCTSNIVVPPSIHPTCTAALRRVVGHIFGQRAPVARAPVRRAGHCA